MQIPSGIASWADLDQLLQGELYHEMSQYSEDFGRRHGDVLRRYGRKWGVSPMQGWSRRWEYPFVAQRVQDFATGGAGAALRVLDAGSGITFFPYYLCDRHAGMTITCCDLARSYAPVYERINAQRSAGVTFVQASLERIPAEAKSFDAAYCVSVLEHTGNHAAILDEFARVLRPGGLLVITFDISLDGRTDISPSQAALLLDEAAKRFDPPAGVDLRAQMGRIQKPDELLTTDGVRRTQPDLLPWPHPVLKSAWDLIHGRGWSGGFFSLACCGMEFRARGGPKA